MLDSLVFPLAFFCSLLTALSFDFALQLRNVLPPGFARMERRLTALFLLSFIFLLTVFLPLFQPSDTTDIDLTQLHPSELFFAHAMMLATLAAWYSLGYVGLAAPQEPWHETFRLRLKRPLAEEISFGFVAGFGAWAAVLGAALLVGAVLSALGHGDVAGEDVSPWIVYMAGLPVAWRLLISLSAGVVEEIFFRGFLQPRFGIAFTTVLFAAGHAGYQQPAMILGVSLLSVIYGLLARRRGNLWAAITAHTLFDAIQLLIVIPGTLQALKLESAAQAACFC